jgi:hypothetical protein
LIGLLSVFYIAALTACGEKSADISILGSNDVFVQTSSINNKLDIMFVVDNSGSMADEQANLATNFNAFMSDFITKSYDYKISVIGTDAWRTQYGFSCNVGTGGSPVIVPCARFRDGQGVPANHSGIFVIDNMTPNPLDVFNLNVRLGTSGTGDERAFQSIQNALDFGSAPNAGFLRSDSFLAIVIVSDEEDFSRPSSNYSNDRNQYNDSAHPYTISNFVSYLDTKTSSTPTNRRYNVSTITAATGSGCTPGEPGHFGDRYVALANATDGIVGNICAANFSSDLMQIQNKISELSTQFRLTRVPVVSTIVVKVNGLVISHSPTNGWTYNPTANSIVFHGPAIPAQGALIRVDFDPVSLD